MTLPSVVIGAMIVNMAVGATDSYVSRAAFADRLVRGFTTVVHAYGFEGH